MERLSITAQLRRSSDEPCPEFTVTREELVILFRHWYSVLLDNRRFFGEHGITGPSDVEDHEHVLSRLDEIERELGEELAAYLMREIESDEVPS